jgi:hypothetical protein
VIVIKCDWECNKKITNPNGVLSGLNYGCLETCGSRDSAVGIATGYELDDRGVGVRVPVKSRIFSSRRRPDRFWGSPNFRSTGYRGSFPGGKAAVA